MKPEITPQNNYLNTNIFNTPYLLPYGQNIVDYCNEIKLNETGDFIWKAISNCKCKEEILNMLIQKHNAKKDEIDILDKDLTNFINMLLNHGLIIDNNNLNNNHLNNNHFYKIGPLRFQISAPDQFYNEYFNDFACDKCNADQTISFCNGRPQKRLNGNILIRTDEIIIIDADKCYIFLFSEEYGLYEMQVSKDGKNVTLYCRPLLSHEHYENIFHVLRFAFLIIAQHNDLYVVHSASILYNEKAWLFSGSSGTGKSTHTRLWNKIYGTPFINGDLNMIGIDNDVPLVYGIPWCGTSEIFTPKTYPLGGITFLKQAPYNKADIPSDSEKTLLLARRMISPTWTENMLRKNLCFTEKLVMKTEIFRLLCTKDNEAAETIKKCIDMVNSSCCL